MRNRTVHRALNRNLNRNRILALGCVAGPLLFTVAWFVLGFGNSGYEIEGVWIGPYDPVVQPISGLGMGETAPYMNAAFILGGLLTVVGVIGAYGVIAAAAADPPPVAARVGVALLALSGVGLILAGVFTIEQTALHLLGFILVAGLPVVAFPLLGRYLRGIPDWRRFGTSLLAAGPLILLLLVIYLASFDEEQVSAGTGVAGLTSRLLAVGAHAWFVALGVRAARRATAPRARRVAVHPEGNGAGTG